MKTRFRYFSRFGLIGFFIIFTCLGCANVVQKIDKWQASFTETVKETLNFSNSESATEAEKKNGDVYFIHTSRYSGETLGIVADWYTGDSKNGKVLAEINPDLDPKKIEAGSEIFIPVKLLKTRKSMPQKVAARYTANYFAHTVKQDGEKMEMIAGWYTGNAANWEVIARANPKINPNRLKAGNEIFIPPKLLKTRQPISKLASAPTAETPKPKPTASEKKLTPVEEEEIKIFGPKQFPKS